MPGDRAKGRERERRKSAAARRGEAGRGHGDEHQWQQEELLLGVGRERDTHDRRGREPPRELLAQQCGSERRDEHVQPEENRKLGIERLHPQRGDGIGDDQQDGDAVEHGRRRPGPQRRREYDHRDRCERELENSQLSQRRERSGLRIQHAVLRHHGSREERFRSPIAGVGIARPETVALERRLRRRGVALVRRQVGIEPDASAGADHVVLVREAEQRIVQHEQRHARDREKNEKRARERQEREAHQGAGRTRRRSISVTTFDAFSTSTRSRTSG